MADVLVVVDDLAATPPGAALPSGTLGLLRAAAAVGDPVAVHAGAEPLGATAVDALAAAGATAVVSGTTTAERWARLDALAALLARLVTERGAVAVLVGAHPDGTRVAALLGLALRTGVVTDVVSVGPDLRVRKSVPAARVTTTVRVDGVLVATLVPGGAGPLVVDGPTPSPTAAARPVVPHTVVELPRTPDAGPGVRVLERTVRPRTGRPRLADAHVVVAAGRGLSGDLGPVTALADAVGGAVAGSRAAVDAGWLPHEAQVGQTGATVSPAVYVAVGISGAVQHLAGMRGARTVVAVNTDPQAPIFEVADLGIVGDAFVVLPQAVAALHDEDGSST